MAEPQIRSSREALGLPDRPAVKLALSFARIGRADARASNLLYARKLYPQAVFHLQQSVEKSVKATGLLLGLVRPNREDLIRDAGHATIFGILIRRGERLAELRRNLGYLAASEPLKEGRELFLRLGVPGAIPDAKEMEAKLVSEHAARAEVERLRGLRPRDLWKLTLELDPTTPPSDVILKLLDDAEAQWKPLDRFRRTFDQRFEYLVRDPATLRYIMSIHGKALPEIAPLAFITMWHEMETRYPPVDVSDYWAPERYSASSGLVRLYPRLHRHAKRLGDGAYEGARAAMSI